MSHLNKSLLLVLVVLASVGSSSLAMAADESFKATVSISDKKDVKYLRAFQEALKKRVDEQNLSEAYIECANCQELDEPVPTVKRLKYYFLRKRADSLIAIAGAYQDVQREMFSPTFTLSLDGEPPPGGLCEEFVSPPCAPRAFCQSMGGCSKQASPLPCKKCDLKP